MDGFFKFMASRNGRIARIIAGVVLVILGAVVLEGAAGWIVAIIGLVPLSAGLFDWCFFAPLFGKPFLGPDLRKNAE